MIALVNVLSTVATTVSAATSTGATQSPPTQHPIDSPPPWLISWEALDVGRDALSPVTDDYAARDAFVFPAEALIRVDFKVACIPVAKP